MSEMIEEQKMDQIPQKTETIVPGDTKSKTIDTNLTLSTKLSTDQLICKTPQESPSISVKSLRDEGRKNVEKNIVLYLGVLQLVLGFLMVVFGILVVVHRASLSQFGGGIWGGCIAMATGISGVLASAKRLCPLKATAEKITHTVFLALSLISLAVCQLVVVISATGLARDVNKSNEDPSEEVEMTTIQPSGQISIVLPSNYLCFLFNIALLVVASIECICAAFAAYKSSRDLCPCFKKKDDLYKDNLNINNSHALVSSWLGKQSSPSHIYVVGPPSSLGNAGRKLSSGLSMTPIYALPPPMMQPQIIGYPLIPAPLGPVPSPIIPPPSRREMMHRMHKKYQKAKQARRERQPTPSRSSRSRSKSSSKDQQLTEADVVRTYTGLDRTIAEEFIDICDSKHASLCSDFSCTSTTSSSCQSPYEAGCNTNSDAASQDYLVNKM